MQYTKNDWRNRNKIKTHKGWQWLTIPVRVENLSQTIGETQIFDVNWTKKHKASLQTNYSKAKCFNEAKDFVFELYDQASKTKFLSEINYIFIKSICEYLQIDTKITFSTFYNLIDGKTERLVDLCLQTDASHYISGPSAKSYIDEELLIKKNIKLEWMKYSDYQEYDQLFPPFTHEVSVLDLIFNLGDRSKEYLKFYK